MNYYEILEVSVNASKEVIKNAYRALTKKYHPDSYKGDKNYAQEKMKEINEAYETLIDDNKRLLYDYDNGFKIDPNVPKEEVIVQGEEETNKETKKEEKINNKINRKILIIVGVIFIFMVAFGIGSLIAGKDNSKDSTKNEEVEEEKDTNYNLDNN
jgi:DnaJ-class molecular chaperone